MTIYSIYSAVKIEEIIRDINCIDNNGAFLEVIILYINSLIYQIKIH